jgi:hypothetical protein
VSFERPYDFPYAPVPTSAGDDDGFGLDLLVATSAPVAPDAVTAAIAETCGESSVTRVLAQAPLFWTQIHTTRGHRRADVAHALRRAGLPVRYVASASRGSLEVPPPLDLDLDDALRPGAAGWPVCPAREAPPDRPTAGRWFLRDGPGGLGVDRAVCGTGHGTRLAVIDDDAADLENVPLDATVLVGVERAPRASGHGALLIGWAVGARTHDGATFAGVAPDASVRAYVIPRPGDDVVSLALAVARAATDGADVIVCATYVEGSTSPMLDDALEVATRLGRGGRGCVVVLPTGRETSSPKGSVHASLSLSLGDPASDPRVLCVAPGGRGGGWFLWREQHGRLRPFANRGPAVRCLAPGDDLSYPFLAAERLFHAESSGASALAAAVALLVVSNNPTLAWGEAISLLVRSATPPEPLSGETLANMADRADALPRGRDRDGHDAKHGHGRLHALRACIAAADPVCLELVAMGEEQAARGWFEARRQGLAAGAYSPSLACLAVRALLSDDSLAHALRVVLRHVRLLAADPTRADAHAAGAVGRYLALLLRRLDQAGAGATDAQHREIAALLGRARETPRTSESWEAQIVTWAEGLFQRNRETTASAAGMVPSNPSP